MKLSFGVEKHIISLQRAGTCGVQKQSSSLIIINSYSFLERNMINENSALPSRKGSAPLKRNTSSEGITDEPRETAVVS